MQTRGRHPTSGRARPLRPHPLQPHELEELRRALVGPEQQRLDTLECVVPTVESVGTLIPAAMTHASHERGDELAVAMEQPVRRSLREVARHEPQLFGEILAPAIGTAVRRAVTDAFAALLQRINQIVEKDLSWRSLKWRLEAKRTGRSYAEIVLARTLIYRVEWAVLIHSESSLVLEQASSVDAVAQAPDQTSAMLQAINSFVSDALRQASPGAAIQTIEVGDLNLWIEREPTYTIAVAIRGMAPLSLRERLRQTLERVRVLHPDAPPSVDSGQFSDTRSLLADLLEQRTVTPPRRAVWMLGIPVLIALVVAAVWQTRESTRHRREVNTLLAYEQLLEATPGYAVTSIERDDGGGYRIRGLRDPRALPAALVATRAGLPLATFELAPFVSADPRLEPAMAAVDAAIHALEQIRFDFPLDESSPVDPARITASAALIRNAQRAALDVNASLCVDVMGNTDDTGSESRNASLRLARASAVTQALEAGGIDAATLSPHAGDPLRTIPHARTVTFRAFLRPATHDGGCR